MSDPSPFFVRVIEHATGRSSWVGDFGASVAEYSAGSLKDALAAATTTVTASLPFDRDEVLALVAELTSPRAQFLERARARALELAPADDGTVEAFLRRELFLGYTSAIAEVDADMIFGEGKDGREPSQLVGILGDEPAGDPRLFADDPELVRCAGCGVRGQWEGKVVVNAEGRDVPRWCSAPARLGNAVTVGRLRAHGPWLPV